MISKKGVSGILATVIMIALVIGLVAVVWASINSLVNKEIASTESCFGNFGKVSLNKQYTCKNSANGEMQISLEVKDITITGILVSISGQSGSKSMEIKNSSSYAYAKMFGGTYGQVLGLPEKNSGLTYVISLSSLGISDGDSIKIAPIINDNQCEVSDSLSEIFAC